VESLRLFGRSRERRARVGLDIEEPKAVREKLNELCARQHNCEIQIGRNLFTSIFLRFAGESFLTDIMMPSKGNSLLTEGDTIKLGYQERAVPFTFSCGFLGRVDNEGYEALQFALPEVIRYSNRRSFFRVRPDKAAPVRIMIEFDRSQSLGDSARDISGGGVSLLSSFARSLSMGQRINKIEIALPTGGWISCQGTVRRVSGALIGIELENVSFAERSEIVRYVTSRQTDDLASRKQED